jgi:uncharacterized protein YraI
MPGIRVLIASVMWGLGCLGLPLWAGQQVRVTAANVNLRSGPGVDSEVVAQVSKGDLLNVGDQVSTNWVQVVPPDHVDAWIHGTLVDEGVVTAPKAQIRGGPGINYRAMGKLSRGDKVAVRGQWKDWLKVAPPVGAYLWISVAYVEPVTNEEFVVGARDLAPSVPSARVSDVPMPRDLPPAPAPMPPKPEESGIASNSRQTPPPERKAALASPGEGALPKPIPLADDQKGSVHPGLADLDLVPGVVQGRAVEYQGVIRSSGLIWQKSGRYRLVGQDDKNRAVTLCYLLSSDGDMESLLGRKARVAGSEYWIQGLRVSLVTVSRVTVDE